MSGVKKIAMIAVYEMRGVETNKVILLARIMNILM
jgi:hypothetical protein